MNKRVKHNILVVDDDEAVRRIICRHLVYLGHRPVPVEGGAAAILKLTEDRDLYDLVVLDMRMPELDGEATFIVLHQFQPKLFFLLCTGSRDTATITRLLNSGCCELLVKPFTRASLRDKIDGLLARIAQPPPA